MVHSNWTGSTTARPLFDGLVYGNEAFDGVGDDLGTGAGALARKTENSVTETGLAHPCLSIDNFVTLHLYIIANFVLPRDCETGAWFRGVA